VLANLEVQGFAGSKTLARVLERIDVHPDLAHLLIVTGPRTGSKSGRDSGTGRAADPQPPKSRLRARARVS